MFMARIGGEPGTIVLADTCGYHKQLKPESDERVKLVYRVKVEVETRNEALKPGMPADTTLPLDQPITAANAAS